MMTAYYNDRLVQTPAPNPGCGHEYRAPGPDPTPPADLRPRGSRTKSLAYPALSNIEIGNIITAGSFVSPKRSFVRGVTPWLSTLQQLVVLFLVLTLHVFRGCIRGIGEFRSAPDGCRSPTAYPTVVTVNSYPRKQPTSSVVLPDGLRLAHEGDRGNAGSLDNAIGFYRSDRRLAMIRKFYLGGTVIHDHPDFSPVEYWAISLEIYYSLGGSRKIQAEDPELLKFLDYFLEPTA